MQNFKQFLKEDNSEYVIKLIVEFSIRYEDIEDYLKEQKETIIKNIEEKTNTKVFFFDIRKHSFSIELKINNDNQLTQLMQIEKEVVDILEKYNSNDSFQHLPNDTNLELLVNHSLPQHIKISFPYIYITAQGPTSFKGINKIIGDFELLQIRNNSKITDSVLGLLLLNKTNRKISLLFSKNEWVKILNKHLENDNDVLECQEELITNGLRQYAKL